MIHTDGINTIANRIAPEEIQTEIKVGNLVFEYDGKREMYVGSEDEVGGMIENVWPEDWASFVGAIKKVADPDKPQCTCRKFATCAYCLENKNEEKKLRSA